MVKRKPIGQIVREARIARGMRSCELAEEIGKPRSSISSYERGTQQIPSGVLEQIMDELGLYLVPISKLKSQIRTRRL